MKKINKFCYMLFFLCGGVIFSNSYAFETIEDAGEHVISEGNITIPTWGIVDNYKKEIIINVDESISELNANSTASKRIFDIYGDYGAQSGKGASLIWNGNLNASISANAVLGINTNDGSSLEFNGNLSVSGVSTGNNQSNYYDENHLIRVESNSSADFNGNIDLSFQSTIDKKSGGYLAGLMVYRGNTLVNLGKDLSNNVHIHDISVASTNNNGEAYGILGYYSGDTDNNVINVNGNAVIENVKSDYYAAGAEVGGENSVLTFKGNLEIKGIIANEAYALAAHHGARINVNQDGLRTVKLNGDIFAVANGEINLNLNNQNSYLKGGIIESEGGIVNLKLKNGAKWYVEKESSISNITVDQNSALSFYINDINEYGFISINQDAQIDISEGALVELVLGDSMKNCVYGTSLLLIDTSVVLSGLNFDSLMGSISYEGVEVADGWSLKFVEGQGLYAVYGAVPEPATYASILGIFALGIVISRKRK